MYAANVGSKLPLKWNQTATVFFSLVGGHRALSGEKCRLVSGRSHTFSALSPVMGLSQTSSPNQHDQFKAVTKLLIRQNGPTSAFPRLGWLLAGVLRRELGEVALCAASPVELLLRPCPSGWASCLLLAWPALGCLSHVLFDGYWKAPAP